MKKEFVVDFSQLDSQAKQKYVEFLVNNKVSLKQSENNFVAKIKITDKPQAQIAQQHAIIFKNNLYNNVVTQQMQSHYRERDFTPAKEKRQAEIRVNNKSDNNIIYNSNSPPLKSREASPKFARNILSKFSELEDHYSLILSEIRNKDFLSRPLKLQINELIKLIEEIYQLKFQEQSQSSKKQESMVNNFQLFVNKFLRKKYSQQKSTDQNSDDYKLFGQR